MGNVFLGDDGFGVEVVKRLTGPLPAGVRVVDFGIRGIDLAYALAECDAAVLIDATARGGSPGTLYVVEPEVRADAAASDPHAMTPDRVLRWIDPEHAPRMLRLVGCEPESFGPPGIGQPELSAPVQAAVSRAVPLVLDLVHAMLRELDPEASVHA